MVKLPSRTGKHRFEDNMVVYDLNRTHESGLAFDYGTQGRPPQAGAVQQARAQGAVVFQAHVHIATFGLACFQPAVRQQLVDPASTSGRK